MDFRRPASRFVESDPRRLVVSLPAADIPDSVSRFSRCKSFACRLRVDSEDYGLSQSLVDDLFQFRGTSGFRRTGATGARFRIASKIVAVLSPR